MIQVLQCVCLIFHVFQFSHQNPGPTVCISHISHLSLFLAIFQVLQCVFLEYGEKPEKRINWDIHTVEPGLWWENWKKLGKCEFHVIQCLFLIFHVFQFFSPKSRSYSVYFSYFTFSLFLAIFQVLNRTLNMSRKLTNMENEKIMVGPGIWRETWKTYKLRFSFSSFVSFLNIFKFL